MVDLEIPLGKRTRSYRFFERLPAILSYGAVVVLVVLSLVNPVLASAYLLVIILTTLVKVVGISYHMVRGRQVLDQTSRVKWRQRLEDLEHPKEAYAREYGKSKKVDLILWAGYWAFNRDIEGICKHYAEMGIKGFKVDFMDRDDQQMVDFYHRAAQIAAKYNLMLDFHGAYKPTGLQRTYPNVINFEGVHGLEQMKWSPASVDQVTYDVTIPFIRMVAGPMDYTQGSMRNATRNNYRPVYSEPMSQGTRCRQLAQYVIFEAPFNMLCDNPSNYLAEPECTQFIAEIPTVWDETVALNGEISKYVTIARRTGNEWYLGSMTNWDSRTLDVDLSFLGDGNFKAEIFRDGVNAHRTAMDYRKETVDVSADRKMTLKMAPGGGFAMKITKL